MGALPQVPYQPAPDVAGQGFVICPTHRTNVWFKAGDRCTLKLYGYGLVC